MMIDRLTPLPLATAKEAFSECTLRALIADYLGISVERVSDDACFTQLGADWLDRLELLMLIEDRVADIEIVDEDVDQLKTVGDLIRLAENAAQSVQKR